MKFQDVNITSLQEDPSKVSEDSILSSRPYINDKGESVIAVNTGQIDSETNEMVYAEQKIHTNATLRKDEWIQLEKDILEAAQRRLVIIDDLRTNNLVKGVGGLGTIVSEWESASEMTDAEITMDGESKNPEKDRQEFEIHSVPIPVISKSFRIGKRTWLASRNRGASLDTTQQIQAARSVARVSENMVFNGTNLGTVNSAGSRSTVYGLTTFPSRATANISDWADPSTTGETILQEALGLVSIMETTQRHYGPFHLYIPGNMLFQFRQDYKAFSDKTLMQRLLEEDAIENIRASDMLANSNVCMVQMEPEVIDLAVAADITTVQWETGSQWSSHFQVFAAWAPRLKEDFNDRCGIMHATVGSGP